MPSKPGQRQRRPLKWDETQRKALALVFEGRKSQAKIAEDCGISVRTCEDWLAHPEFQARLKTMREHVLESCDLLGAAYVRKEQRLVALAQMAESARTEYETHTWLREVRPSQNGDIVNESFNRDAHAAFRGALDDIAKELGERKAESAANQQPVMRRYILEPRTP